MPNSRVPILVSLCTVLTALACAQDPQPRPPMAVLEPLVHSSGRLMNPTASKAMVHAHDILVPGATSLRLIFASVQIGQEDVLRVMSPINGETHDLDPVELAKWENTSGYFNGDRLRIELILGPGSSGSFDLAQALVGRDSEVGTDSICGTDDRIASTDFRSMRFSSLSGGMAGSAGCTIWLASSSDCALSAGHCFSGGSLLVAETMCPPSTSGGSVQHPPIQYQFTVQAATITFTNGGVGNDWGICRLNNNNLGQSPSSLFGFFTVTPTLPVAGNTIRITGYGTDSGVTNQTLQTHAGPATSPSGTRLNYQTDTTGGNSGSPVIDEATGFAIGIHTHGGCNSSGGGANSGTAATHAAFQTAFTAMCPSGPPPPPQYQVNQPDSTLTIDGALSNGSAAAVASRCTGEATALVATGMNANIGQPYDVGISFLPLVSRSAGGTTVADSQVINLNLASLIFFSTLSTTAAMPPWTGDFNVPFTTSAAGTISCQMLNVSPSHAGGYALSQGAQLDIYPAGGGTFPAGPTGDDSSVLVALGGQTCLPSVPFYGTARTSFYVISNGRVIFGGSDTDWTPSVAESMTDNPFIGFWTDLNPALGGTITMSAPVPGLIRVSWNAVRYYAETGTATFAVEFDTATGTVAFDGLTGIGPNIGSSTGDSEYLGISRGNSGATDSGLTTFAVGGSGSPSNGTRMWYDFYTSSTGTGKPASLLPGTLNRIVFTPAPNGNYSWQGF